MPLVSGRAQREGEAGRSALAPEPTARDLTSFVGREHELERLTRLVESPARLISVVGAPGMGKTRIVRRLFELLPTETRLFCDLRGVESTEHLCAALTESLHGHLETGGEPTRLVDAVGSLLKARGPMVVALDNFEQLVPTGTGPIRRWLDLTSSITFVVTSRRLLRLRAEHAIELPPLGREASGTAVSEASQLFIARASAAEPAFDSRRDRTDIAELAHRLEGIPLALELAASQMRFFTPRELLDSLRTRPSLTLVADTRDYEPRHRSLRSAIESSWRLLPPYERSALSQLSVFRQGFTLEAAEAVVELPHTGEPTTVRQVVGSLRERCLLRVVDDSACGSGARRWDMYEAIREYASEQPVAGARERHFSFFQALGNALVRELYGPSAHHTRERLVRDLPNLQAAIEYALRSQSIGAAGELALIQYEIHRLSRPALAITPLSRVIENLRHRSQPEEATRQARLVLARAVCHRSIGEVALAQADFDTARMLANSEPSVRTELEIEQAALFFWCGRTREARSLLEEAIARATNSAMKELEARGRLWLGYLLFVAFQDPRATEELDRVLELAVDRGEAQRESFVRMMRAAHFVFRCGEEYPVPELRAQAEHGRRSGNRDVEALSEQNLGIFYLDEGDYERSRLHLERAITISRTAGLRRHQACAECWLAMLDESGGTSGNPSERCERTVAVFESIGDERTLALALLESASLAATENLDLAYQRLRRGEEIAQRFEEQATLLLAELQRARVELTESRRHLAAGFAEEGQRLAMRAERRANEAARMTAPSDGKHGSSLLAWSPEARWAWRCFQAELPVSDTYRSTLHVWANGQRFQLDERPAARLPAGSVVQSALLALIEQHAETPGEALSLVDLCSRCWPGERLSTTVRSQRIRQVMTRLRKAGLHGALRHQRDGYLLCESLALRRTAPSRP